MPFSNSIYLLVGNAIPKLLRLVKYKVNHTPKNGLTIHSTLNFIGIHHTEYSKRMRHKMQANPIVEAMLNPQTYPEKTGKIELIQTHISFVFVTENYVYKVKKPVNFGFLDFSTLDKRKAFLRKRTPTKQTPVPRNLP